MAGRFGKYGDAKRKALIRKKRLKPLVPKTNKGKGRLETPGRETTRSLPKK